MLGYSDLKEAIKKFVDEEDKTNLNELNKSMVQLEPQMGGVQHPPQNMVIKNHKLGAENYSFRESQMIFISETGLYSLILSSQAPFAKEFKRLVCRTILPSIRKYGGYEFQLSQMMKQLAIKEKSEQQALLAIEAAKAVEEELQHKLSKAEEAQIKAESQAKLDLEARIRAERKSVRVNKFMRRVTIKEKKLEWIYIATTRVYSSERLFKVGSTTRLSTRISGYNTGRPNEDSYYYSWVKKCYNSKDLDYHIQKLLFDFKHKENTELYCGIKFSDLKAIVNFIVDNYDASIDYINNFIKTRLNESLEEEDEPPPRLDYKKITYQLGEHTETIDLEEEDTSMIRDELENILSSIKDQQNSSDILIIDRKELIDRLLKITNLNKKELWGQIKDYTGWRSGKTEIDDGEFKYKIVY